MPGSGAVAAAPLPLWLRVLQAPRVALTAWLRRANYPQRWVVLGVLIGAIAGVGAVAFFETLKLATHLLLFDIGGYQAPTPVNEGALSASPGFVRPWALPLVVCGGALVGAILVHLFARDAAGHGTDAAISAVHDEPRGIRLRTVLVKIVASALTIGSGGSGGREGPTGQISAGFGSLLVRQLDLTPADARTAVATGIGSGIGSIFGAPLGGAVLATEILYRDDADMSVLLPGFIASIVGFVIFASVEGFGPIFGSVSGYTFNHPAQLGWFAAIGVLGGLIGLLYAKGFYAIESGFLRVRLPGWMRPALGGLLVGALALAVPQVLGTGYGWVQQALGPGLLGIPLWIVLLVPLARIVATGLSIGSGGSGGIFGPGMVIGAFLGAALWRLVEPVGLGIGHDPAPFVIVGMMCCFGSIARAPLAVMLMVAEMTGNLPILVPAMIAVGLASLIVRAADDSIYRSQLPTRADSPSQRVLAGLPLLASMPAERASVAPRLVLSEGLAVEEAVRQMVEAGVPGAPVVDSSGRYRGVAPARRDPDEPQAVITAANRGLPEPPGTEQGNDRRPAVEPGEPVTLGGWNLLDREAPTVTVDDHLDVAVELLTSRRRRWLPVVDLDRRLVGTLATSDVVTAYRQELQANLRRLQRVGESTGTADVEVDEGSTLCGKWLGAAGFPAGVMVTSIRRGNEVIVPEARTVLQAGDRLALLGSPEDLRRWTAQQGVGS